MAPDNRTAKKRWTYAWQAPFLKWLTKRGNVADACRKTSVSRSWAYDVRGKDPDFAAAWDEAVTAGAELLEGEAFRRAKEGVLKPVYQGGKRVGSVREYSDTLLIFLLKAHHPEKYRDNYRVEHAGEIGVTVDDPRTELLSRISRLAARGSDPDGDPGDDAG